MISGAVSCPTAPLLLPGLTGGPVPAVEELRQACLAAVRDLLVPDLAEVAVIGSDVAWGDQSLAEAVGTYLLREAGCTAAVSTLSIAADAPAAECLAAGRALGLRSTAVLVLADGSACRGVKAPGYLDPRAEPFDAAVQRALDTADAGTLASLDCELAAELLAGGRAAWQVLAGAADGLDLSTQTYYADDPFGVWYPVVRWTPAG
jgi:hypothetical protein